MGKKAGKIPRLATRGSRSELHSNFYETPPCFECFERFGKQKIHILLLLCRAIFACLVKYVSSLVSNTLEEGTRFLIVVSQRSRIWKIFEIYRVQEIYQRKY